MAESIEICAEVEGCFVRGGGGINCFFVTERYFPNYCPR